MIINSSNDWTMESNIHPTVLGNITCLAPNDYKICPGQTVSNIIHWCIVIQIWSEKEYMLWLGTELIKFNIKAYSTVWWAT